MSQDVIRDRKLGRSDHDCTWQELRRLFDAVKDHIAELEAENEALKAGNNVVPSIGAPVTARTVHGERIEGTLAYVYVAVPNASGRLLHEVSPTSVIRTEVA